MKAAWIRTPGRRRAKFALLCGGLLLAACAATPRRAPPSSFLGEDAYRDKLRVLAADDFGGRRPGTAGGEKTVQYLAAEFARIGLKPANGKSFLQPVPLVEIAAGADASLSFSAPGHSQALAYRKDMVIWTKREIPEATLQNSPVVFAGYGIVAPRYGWNDYAGVDVRGKTVVILGNDPGFAGRTMTRYGRPAYKFDEAARQGAAGVLLIHETASAGYDWNVLVNRFGGPQLEAPAADHYASRAAVEGWISAAAARTMFTAAGLDFDTEAAAASRPGFRAVALRLAADGTVHNSIRTFDSANVVAILPGHKRRDEYIVYTAHWDSLGTLVGGAGGICNGAVDNASGVAGLLLLARSFAATRPAPDRSIVFMAPTAAEYGLLGSAFYVEHPLFPLADTVADINLDTLHIGGPTRDVSVIGFGQSALERYLSSAALLQGRIVRAEPNPQQGNFFDSDVYSFAEHGVPGLYAVGGIDDTARGPVWGKAELDEYRAQRFEQAGDKYSPDFNLGGTIEDLNLYYSVGMRLAQTQRFPNWYQNSEYRAMRDRIREQADD